MFTDAKLCVFEGVNSLQRSVLLSTLNHLKQVATLISGPRSSTCYSNWYQHVKTRNFMPGYRKTSKGLFPARKPKLQHDIQQWYCTYWVEVYEVTPPSQHKPQCTQQAQADKWGGIETNPTCCVLIKSWKSLLLRNDSHQLNCKNEYKIKKHCKLSWQKK